MTAKSIILTTAGFLALLSLVKLAFVYFFDMSAWYMVVLFLISIGLVSTGIVRRAGVINNFEVIIGLVLWAPLMLLWDFIALVPVLGMDIYNHLYWWLGYVVMIFAIIVFHKWAPLDKG